MGKTEEAYFIIGGELDGEIMYNLSGDKLVYPKASKDEYGWDEGCYKKERLRVKLGDTFTIFNLLIPEDWDIFRAMNHLFANYNTAIKHVKDND